MKYLTLIKVNFTLSFLIFLPYFSHCQNDISKNHFGVSYNLFYPFENPNQQIVKISNNYGIFFGRKMGNSGLMIINPYYSSSKLFKNIIGGELGYKYFLHNLENRNNLWIQLSLGFQSSFKDNYIQYTETTFDNNGIPISVRSNTWVTNPKVYYSRPEFGLSFKLFKNFHFEPSFGYFMAMRNFKNVHLDSFLQNIPIQDPISYEMNEINPKYFEWKNFSFGAKIITKF
jgi:hypothetical protein